jgi:hypothetical protein
MTLPEVTMARVLLVIIAAMTVAALPLTTLVARTRAETRCKEICNQAPAALSGQQNRLLQKCIAAGTCAKSSNSPRDVESKPNVRTFEPYPCKFFMC